MKTNFLLLTADDLNYDSVGCFGCSVPNITPNIDALANAGMRFCNSHVTIAVCQPSRSVLLTGRYPHRNGARGFECISEQVPTLTEVLSRHGIYNGIIGKEDHIAPRHKFAWDEYISVYNEENHYGRSPLRYYEHTTAFLQHAKAANKQFFLMANIHDPHRPFANSAEELDYFNKNLPVDYEYQPEDITVPGCLPDIKDIRKELAQYFSSVRRCDQTVGEILRALEEQGLAESTCVLFLSDNGMALPFAKTNCYLNSTKSPWIMRWQGKIAPGTSCGALVAGIDFAPTVLDILNLPPLEGADGTPFTKVLTGECSEHHDDIYTFFFKTANNPTTKCERHFPMRCVQDKQYAYIFNSWSDDNTVFVNESMSGITFRAMQEAAKTDEAIAQRVRFCQYRVKEELYDFTRDPQALHNIVDDPQYRVVLNRLKDRMYDYMKDSCDELLPEYEAQVYPLKQQPEKGGEYD